jgi:hypothetical protein
MLAGYGAWDDDEMADNEANLDRLVWLTRLRAQLAGRSLLRRVLSGSAECGAFAVIPV